MRHRNGINDGQRAIWVKWLVGALVTLIAATLLVLAGGYHGGILLGWAVGMTVSAMLILLRR